MMGEASAIGRVKTVLVLGRGKAAKAVVATLSARVRHQGNGRRVTVTGPATFQPAVVKHLTQDALPVVDQIVEAVLPDRPPASFELSVVNLGAASVRDIGLEVHGYSADAASLLAFLSAALQLPVPQDVVVTGHVASPDGDIGPVANIPAKLDAAIDDPEVGRFICPRLDVDASLRTLSPQERERAGVAIRKARGRIRIAEVGGVDELLRTTLSEEDLMLGALSCGFFSGAEADGPHEEQHKPIPLAARFLREDHESRFWRVVEEQLLGTETDGAKHLLLERVRHHVGQQRYPEGFGRRLLSLLASLPPALRRLRLSFPLLPRDECLQLSKLADGGDYEDVRCLLDAACGALSRAVPPARAASSQDASSSPHDHDEYAEVDAVLAEISAENLAHTIGLPIDSARAAYAVDRVTVDSHEEFLDAVAAFHLFLLRRTDAGPPSVDLPAAEKEAVALLERAHAHHGGLIGAEAEARQAISGGMRRVLDVMTEQMKSEQQAKHVQRVLVAALDPLDWDARVRFMGRLLERLKPHLPAELLRQPPARYARRWEVIAQAYVKSLDQVRELLRTL